MSEKIPAEIAAKIFCEVASGGCVLSPDGMLHKRINGVWISKPAVQLKNHRNVWLEDAKPEDIDDRYYNLDGTEKL